jgi:energy-coupling factor transporter ATP-binding protein EcfA2
MHSKEAVDAAEERLAALIDQIPDFANSLNSEADVRSKVIDPIFNVVLGWPKNDVHLETQAGEGFIDYRLTIDGLSKLIVEAKKDGRDFAIAKEKNGRHFKLNGPVFRNPHVAEGVEQAIRYCGHKNAELACVTNGRQWVVFRGNRGGDGHDTVEGFAFVFASLEGVRGTFSLFYDLLAYEAVAQHVFSGHFQNAEGKSDHVRRKRFNVRNPESRTPIQGDRLSGDLDRVLRLLLRDISGDENREARRFCFVTTPESKRAEDKLARVSEDLRNTIKSLDTKEGEEITEAIRRVQVSHLRECVLLVGTKGSGKSTFIERFFEDILTRALRDDCLIASIDLSTCEGDENTIIQWLDRHCLETVEKAMFPNGPSYDDLRGVYWGEYGRWKHGEFKPLYDRDAEQFRIKFGEFMHERRQTEPHEYIEHLLTDAVRKRKKVPCLVFDNADHFNVPFQERVFQYAHSLFKNSLCLVIVPITDTTSWQLPRQGPLQSFYTDSYYLPTPPVEVVLQRRIEYLDNKLRGQTPEPGRGYFFGEHGSELEISDLRTRLQIA